VVRDFSLLDSALRRPEATSFGVELYPTLLEKGAALFQSLACNHPLVDGNKRSAFVVTMTFLRENGQQVPTIPTHSVLELTMAIATRELTTVSDIAERLGELIQTRSLGV